MVDYKNCPDVAIEAFDSIFNPTPSVEIVDWPIFNQITGGLRMNEFSIICGGTGVGKTTFLANISAALLKQSVPHFVMSVETGHVDYMRRVISCLAGMDLNTCEKINPDNPELQKTIANVLPIVSRDMIKFSTHENRISCEQLLIELKFMNEIFGSSVAIIDNLNFFLEVTSSTETILEMDRVVHDIIMFCKEHKMHIFMVMHPKKTDHGQVLSEFDIKGSSTAVQEAQNIFLLNRPTQKECENIKDLRITDRLLKIAKMRRRGRFVGKTIVYQSNGVNYYEKGTF